MTDPSSVIDAQVRHLLDVVERHRTRDCAKIQRQADKQAHALIEQAHKDARARAHDDFNRTREQSRRQLISAQARLKTKRRLARQQSDEAVLQAGWNRLQEALERRWQQAETRQVWVDMLVSKAEQTLLAKRWRVEYPADWPDDEIMSLQKRLQETLGHKPDMQPDTGVRAGLRLCAEGTCVDGTSSGLLHDRSRIEAMMLASLHQHDDAGHD